MSLPADVCAGDRVEFLNSRRTRTLVGRVVAVTFDGIIVEEVKSKRQHTFLRTDPNVSPVTYLLEQSRVCGDERR